MFVKPIKIGNVELKNNIFLAPMAGITDLPFRVICKSMGPGLCIQRWLVRKESFITIKALRSL